MVKSSVVCVTVFQGNTLNIDDRINVVIRTTYLVSWCLISISRLMENQMLAQLSRIIPFQGKRRYSESAQRGILCGQNAESSSFVCILAWVYRYVFKSVIKAAIIRCWTTFLVNIFLQKKTITAINCLFICHPFVLVQSQLQRKKWTDGLAIWQNV